MSDGTTLLFALPGFRVLTVTTDSVGGRSVLVEMDDPGGGCPSCGVISTRVHERPVRAVKDLPHGAVPLRVSVLGRRLRCAESACPRRSFTQTCPQLPLRARLTDRLRSTVTQAVTSSNRAVSDVAAEYRLSWPTVHRALIAAAAALLPTPAPTTVIGIDETRARSVRWLRTETGWRRSDPWMTSIVDLDPAHPGGLIGLAPGRSGACVEGWVALQSQQFRDTVEVVAIDPSAPYASGIRRALPAATIVVDHWHLVRLANAMVTDVRQRVQREQTGRRGNLADPKWTNRRLLLAAGDRLSPRALARLVATLRADDPTDEIGAAWGVKELLRQLLAANGPTRYSRHEVSERRTRFYDACIDAQMPETSRLAATVATWWPQIEAFLQLGITNARTEGYNRIIKQTKRVACGFRNQTNYERRIMLHIAARRAA